ncbi:hypothetical protein GGS23DRAFT_600824 [Durotheca rogersii]|uniref:uncharacterized protein n=1 Tax=Durotheca rogersii TaxID=419775 RepID=UPI00221F6B1D|nr:uncharacterized protein GGS23DRAFT_600824 [Durotheca rogersii]KAI5857491.1 hypothetical protein GGS23DRAFT_600824 [Durotheca rogersii]
MGRERSGMAKDCRRSLGKSFESIIPARVGALESVEKIIVGVPHTVQDDSVSLGISSGHIYSDTVVFSTQNAGSKSIHTKDGLVHPGEVMSLELSNYELGCSPGVYCSLFLANRRSYGRAIHKSFEVNGDGTG